MKPRKPHKETMYCELVEIAGQKPFFATGTISRSRQGAILMQKKRRWGRVVKVIVAEVLPRRPEKARKA